MENDRSHLYNRIIISVLIAVIVFLLFICAFLFLTRGEAPVLSPDIAPSKTDKYAEPMDDGSQGTMESPDGGGAASLAYTKNVAINLSTEKARMMFGNPSRSNQDIIVQVIIQDTVIAQSGLITPGNKVTTLDLVPKIKSSLSEGTYIGKYLVLFYDRETGEKEIVTTEIAVNITVEKR